MFKFTEETASEIIRLVRACVTISHAAEICGISRTAAHNWRVRGEREQQQAERGHKLTAEENRYAQFALDLARARATAAAKDIATINHAAHAQKDWKAAAWRLERQLPKEFGARAAVELTGKDGGPVEIEETRNRLRERLAELAATTEPVEQPADES
jgi:hypothetical protein